MLKQELQIHPLLLPLGCIITIMTPPLSPKTENAGQPCLHLKMFPRNARSLHPQRPLVGHTPLPTTRNQSGNDTTTLHPCFHPLLYGNCSSFYIPFHLSCPFYHSLCHLPLCFSCCCTSIPSFYRRRKAFILHSFSHLIIYIIFHNHPPPTPKLPLTTIPYHPLHIISHTTTTTTALDSSRIITCLVSPIIIPWHTHTFYILYLYTIYSLPSSFINKQLPIGVERAMGMYFYHAECICATKSVSKVSITTPLPF